jgi:hypothetical protein
MSKLNINRNIFLEREELLRWQKFLIESNVNQVFLANTLTWGIIDTSGGESPQDFKVEVGTNSGTVKINELSRALTKSGLLIKQSALDNIIVPNDGNYYWMKISHKYSNIEEGECSITADGQLSGINTKFSEVLRGQGTEVPVKIKFVNSVNNTGVYEVVNRDTDTFAILAGDNFTAESGLKYFVIGSVPLGDMVTSSQEQGLYFYDSCDISFVIESISDIAPGGKVTDEEFWIARVRNSSGSITIEDKRTEYWQYYIKGVSDKLSKQENLADLGNVQIARDNLNVYSKEETEDLVGVDVLNWVGLTREAGASATGYDIKLKRIGNICVCQGTFIATSSATVGNKIASLTETYLGGTINVPIYFATNGYIAGTDNKGLKLHLESSGGVISIVVDDNVSQTNIEYRFNFTFFLDA